MVCGDPAAGLAAAVAFVQGAHPWDAHTGPHHAAAFPSAAETLPLALGR